MSELYNISSSPHIRAKDTSAKIMLYVIIALLPASIFGVYNFGLRALLLIAVCIASCVASEWIFEKIVHKKSTITDFSAVLTGLLLALNLPHTLPIWQAVLGSIFAIVIVKMLFGGLGQNFMNPALGARCFLLVSFASTMTSFTYDGVTGATPLALMRNGESVDTMKMFLGTTAGTIGETSVIALLIGAVFLLLMGVIDLRIPGSYLITFVVFLLIFSGKGFDVNYIAAQLCGGGLMLGAFFMATDYVTSPITPSGKIIYGILDILVNVFRSFPFIILMVIVIPFTRMIAGKAIGTKAALVPLTISAIPFVARVIESALRSVDHGLIEAARSFGAGDLQIIFRVYLKEALPAILSGITLTMISLIGYSAMGGAIGAGGLGDVAIRYGYQAYKMPYLISTSIVLIIFVQVIQSVGNLLYKKLS